MSFKFFEGLSEKKQTEAGHIDRLITNLVGYVDTQFKLIQLEVKDEISNAITLLILVLIVSIIAAFSGLLFSVALAMYLGEVIGNVIYGYLIVGGGYLALGGIVVSQFKKIRTKISALINKKVRQIEIKKSEKKQTKEPEQLKA